MHIFSLLAFLSGENCLDLPAFFFFLVFFEYFQSCSLCVSLSLYLTSYPPSNGLCSCWVHFTISLLTVGGRIPPGPECTTCIPGPSDLQDGWSPGRDAGNWTVELPPGTPERWVQSGGKEITTFCGDRAMGVPYLDATDTGNLRCRRRQKVGVCRCT